MSFDFSPPARLFNGTGIPDEMEISPEQSSATPVEQLVQPFFFFTTKQQYRKKKLVANLLPSTPSTERIIAKPLEFKLSEKEDTETPEFAKPITVAGGVLKRKRKTKKKVTVDIKVLNDYVRWGFFDNFDLISPIDSGDSSVVLECSPKQFMGFSAKPKYAVKIQIVGEVDNYNKLNRINYSRILKCKSCFDLFRELQQRIHVVTPRSYLRTLKALQEASFIKSAVKIVDFYLENSNGEMISYIVMKKYEDNLESMWRVYDKVSEDEENSKKGAAINRMIQDERFHALFKIVETSKEMFSRGVLHTDLKPNNVFTQKGPLGVKYRIGDFGDCHVRTTDSEHMFSFLEKLLMLCQKVFNKEEMERLRSLIPEEYCDLEACIPEFMDTILEICAGNVRNVGDIKRFREMKNDNAKFIRIVRKKDVIIKRKEGELQKLRADFQKLARNSDPELLRKLNIELKEEGGGKVKKENEETVSNIGNGHNEEEEEEPAVAEESESVLGKRKRKAGNRIEGFEIDTKKRKM